MVNEKMVYNFAVNSQGFEGSFVDFQNLPADERAEYELGAGAVSRKIEFFTHENGMAVWAGAGVVDENNEIKDCPLDFNTDDYEEIYEAVSEEISEGETEGEFLNKFEVKYSWEVK